MLNHAIKSKLCTLSSLQQFYLDAKLINKAYDVVRVPDKFSSLLGSNPYGLIFKRVVAGSQPYVLYIIIFSGTITSPYFATCTIHQRLLPIWE